MTTENYLAKVTSTHPHQKPAGPLKIGRHRFSTVGFLVALVFFLASTPFVEEMPHGDIVDGSLLTLVLASGVLAVGGSLKRLIAAIVLASPAVIGRWLHQFVPGLPHEYFLIPGLLFIAFVMGNLLQFILQAPRVTAEVLCAGLSTYLLLGMAWMFAYLLVSERSPGAINIISGPDAGHALGTFDAYYFSYTTLCTVGFGDIIPASHVARTLAAAEGITGTLFMAVLIARLVALYSSQPPAPAADNSGQAKPE
jgi:Ion channel